MAHPSTRRAPQRAFCSGLELANQRGENNPPETAEWSCGENGVKWKPLAITNLRNSIVARFHRIARGLKNFFEQHF
jgi:hypothetical protein